MSQDYQSIGQPTPQVEKVADQHKGWTTGPLGDPTPYTTLEDQITDAGDTSFWNRRANKQELGLHIPNMADYSETPMAAFTPRAPAADAEPDDR